MYNCNHYWIVVDVACFNVWGSMAVPHSALMRIRWPPIQPIALHHSYSTETMFQVMWYRFRTFLSRAIRENGEM